VRGWPLGNESFLDSPGKTVYLKLFRVALDSSLSGKDDYDYKHDVALELNYESCLRTVCTCFIEDRCMHLHWSRSHRSLSPNPANNSFFDFGNGVEL